MQKITLLGIAASLFLLLLTTACEREYIPEDVFDEPDIVVEGYVEYGDSALPPYVILTKSSPYLSRFTAETLNDLFIRDAEVYVSDGSSEIRLTQVCLSDVLQLDSALAQSVAQSIGLGGASLDSLDYCVYVDIAGFLGSSPIQATPGQSYYLTVIVEEDTITSVTTVPNLVEFDSIFVVSHPDFPDNDSLVELRAIVSDPPEENFYRAFTQRNSEPMYAIASGSVVDDKIFNGGSFELPIQRAEPLTEDLDIDTYGYFWRGDTIVFRGANIDYAQYRFWQTLEYNTGTQGPFSSYVRIESNINGGLGLWGGVAFKDYRLIVPR